MPHRLLIALLSAVATAPLPVATADAPKISSLFPAGARRGESARVEAKGAFDPWPVDAKVDRPGVEFHASEEVGVFEVVVAPDATPGLCWVRFSNEQGAAPQRPFAIGTLPEIAEVEPNDADHQAQPVEPPSLLINGRLQKSGDVDAYSIPLESGQTLVAALDAHRRLGSPMDAVIQVVSGGGFVLDHADDSPGLDPTLCFTAPESGTYIVRVFAFPSTPDSSIRFAGGDDFVYRLTLTTGGYVDLAHPLSLSRNDDLRVSPVGWNLPEEGPLLDVALGPGDEAFAWRDDVAGAAQLGLVDLPVILEPGPEAEPIVLPALICGRIARSDEVDVIPVRVIEGRSVRFRVSARSLGAPLDPILRVVDGSGGLLAEADDNRRSPDPELTIKASADDVLQLHVRDLHGRGGPRFVYQIDAVEVAPDFTLSVDSDHLELHPGKPLEIAVAIDRNDGFDRPISFEVEGLPQGVSLDEVRSEPKGDTSKKVTLRLHGPDAQPFSGTIRLLGRAEGDGEARFARADRIGGLPTPDLWLTICPADRS